MQNSILDTSDQIKEFRAGSRFDIILNIRGFDSSGLMHEFLLRNVSITGLLFESGHNFEIGDTLDFALPIVGSQEGRIRWRSECLFGCEFNNELSAGMVAALRLRGQPPNEVHSSDLRFASLQRESFHQVLARLRKEAGLTLSDVATALNVSKPTVWAWEKGKARPLPERLEAISKLYNVAAEDLLEGAGQDADHPRLVIEECRMRIAKTCNTTPSAVRMMIEL